jgi:hypothetical protein
VYTSLNSEYLIIPVCVLKRSIPAVLITKLINMSKLKDVSCTFKLRLREAEIMNEQTKDNNTKSCSREKIIHFEVIFVKGLKYLDIGFQSFE